MTQPNDFGGGFDAADESTKVAAPPLAALPGQPTNLTKVPVPTNHQPSDGIGIRTRLTGEVRHPLGTWNATTGTTDAAGVPVGPRHQVITAGTQAIDISAPL